MNKLIYSFCTVTVAGFLLIAYYCNTLDNKIDAFSKINTAKVRQLSEEIDSVATILNTVREEQKKRTDRVYTSVTTTQSAVADENAADICIMRVSKKGTIMDCSSGITGITGYGQKDVIGEDIKMFMSNDLRDKHVSFLAADFKTKILCDRPGKILNKEGKYIDIEITIVSLDKFYIVTVRKG